MSNATDQQTPETSVSIDADCSDSLQVKFDRLFDVTKRYCECDHAQLRGEHFRDMAATVQALEGTATTYGWPQCFARIERGMWWVVKKLRTHHSTRPGITAICDRAERCLRGLEIEDQ